MKERQPEPTELDEATEKQIDYMMNTRGFSRADAMLFLSPRDQQDVPEVLEASKSQYRSPESVRVNRPRRGRTGIVEDSRDVYTGIISEQQAATNSVGAAAVRAAIHANDSELTPQQRAIDRARRERSTRRW